MVVLDEDWAELDSLDKLSAEAGGDARADKLVDESTELVCSQELNMHQTIIKYNYLINKTEAHLVEFFAVS